MNYHHSRPGYQNLTVWKQRGGVAMRTVLMLLVSVHRPWPGRRAQRWPQKKHCLFPTGHQDLTANEQRGGMMEDRGMAMDLVVGVQLPVAGL